MSGRRDLNGKYPSSQETIKPQTAHLAVLRADKSVLFECSYVNSGLAIEHARKYYNKPQAHDVRVVVGAQVIFHFIADVKTARGSYASECEPYNRHKRIYS